MENQLTSRIRSAALVLLAFILCLSCFGFALGLPWQDFGVWPEQELPAAGFHAVSAAVAALVGLLVALGDRKALGAVTSGPFLFLLALALVTLAAAPYSSAPWTSVYGTLQHEIGGLWHFELAVLVAGSSIVLASRWKTALLVCIGSFSLAVTALAASPGTFGLSHQFLFEEWSGLAAGAASLAIAVRARKLLSAQTALAVALLVFGLFASGNRAVGIAAIAAALVAVAYRLPWTGSLLGRRSVRASLAILVSLAGLVSMWAIAPAIEAHRLPSAPASVEGLVSDIPADRINLMGGSLGTLWSRSYMIRIIVDDLAEHPAALLHGNGWGAFTEVYERHAREVPGRMFRTPLLSASRTYWDSHTKADFHSHNMAAEALNAGGLPGLALWLGFLGALAASSRSGFIVSVAIGVASTFWFPLVHMTEALAVLVAAGASLGRPGVAGRKAISAIAPLPAIAAVACLGMAGLLAFSLARLETAERHFEGVVLDSNPATCSAITARFLPEREATLYLYRVLVNKVTASADPYRTVFDHASNVGLLSCALRSFSVETTDIRSLAESLTGRAKLASAGPGALGIVAPDLIAWGKDIDAMLAAAPERTDFIPPYIQSLASRQSPRLLDEAERYAAVVRPDDPVRYFLLSVVAGEKKDVAGSKAMMRRALSLGYANIMPSGKAFIEGVMAE